MIYWRQASSVAETHGLLGVDVTIVKTIHGVAVVLSCLWVVGLNADALRRIEVQSVVAGVCNWGQARRSVPLVPLPWHIPQSCRGPLSIATYRTVQ